MSNRVFIVVAVFIGALPANVARRVCAELPSGWLRRLALQRRNNGTA